LALLALAHVYGQKLVSEGPSFRAIKREGGGLRVSFDHTDGGLAVQGERPAEFSLAGADRKWHWADAKIDGDTIVVSSAEVPEPVAVRYAWQANPQATLFNGAGLPAAPFRSDDWPGITEGRDPW
jgi:sialate O-acetylesterase